LKPKGHLIIAFYGTKRLKVLIEPKETEMAGSLSFLEQPVKKTDSKNFQNLLTD